MTRAVAAENEFRERLRQYVRRKRWKLVRCQRCIRSTVVLTAAWLLVLSVTDPESAYHRLALMGAILFGGLLIAHAVAWIVRKARSQPEI